jgi:hypothetical protein
MSWFVSILVGFFSGALGLLVGGAIANMCAGWYRISSFEGKSGYFIVINAILGGILGLALGLVISRAVAATAAPGFLKALGLSGAAVIAAGGAVLLVAWRGADIPPKIAGRELMLEVEWRLPAGETSPPAGIAGASSFTLGSVANHRQRKSGKGELKTAEARLENGRWIIPASVFLFTSRGLRSIGAELGGKSLGGFIVPLPARPGPKFERWSDWGPLGPAPDRPWPETKTSFRFRVVRIDSP